MKPLTKKPAKRKRHKMPKPVEAWAQVGSNGWIDVGGYDPEWQEHYGQWQSVRVRIVPVKPQKRRVRKEK